MRFPIAFSTSVPTLRGQKPVQHKRVAQQFLCCLAPPHPLHAQNTNSRSASRELLRSVAEKAIVSEEKLDRLEELGRIVLAANKTTNLTAVRTEDGLISRHLVDALGLLPLLDTMSLRTIVDLGSGAGFPGLVLAICRPWSVTLVEASRKKSRFHNTAIQELSLPNVESVWGRAEELGHDPLFRESFDVCVARAVAQMPVLSELALPLVRVGGALVAQKSVEKSGHRREIQSASNAISKLGGKLENVELAWTGDYVRTHMPSEAESEDEELQRAFVVIRKSSTTTARYPRLAGTPKKNPL